MFDDIDLPGLDDLLELLDGFHDLLGLDDLDVTVLDDPIVSVWPEAGSGVEFFDPNDLWLEPELPVYGAAAMHGTFGAMELPNPFHADSVASGGSLSTEDLICNVAVNTGLSAADFPI